MTMRSIIEQHRKLWYEVSEKLGMYFINPGIKGDLINNCYLGLIRCKNKHSCLYSVSSNCTDCIVALVDIYELMKKYHDFLILYGDKCFAEAKFAAKQIADISLLDK